MIYVTVDDLRHSYCRCYIMVATVLHHQVCQHESGMTVQSVEISNLRANLEIAKGIAHFANPQCICNGLYIVIVTTCLELSQE